MSEFELSIIGPAFLASLLVLSTHVPLGTEVLRRGIIFIDLAIAQVAGLGVIAADTMGWEAQGLMVQIAAVGSALVAAWILHWTDRRWPQNTGSADRGCFYSCRDCRNSRPRRQSARWRAPQGVAGRTDTLGKLRTAAAGGSCKCPRIVCLVLDARSSGGLRFLRTIRVRCDRIRTTRRHLSRVRLPDHSGTRYAEYRESKSAYVFWLRCRRRRLPCRADSVRWRRPSRGCDHRLVAGNLGTGLRVACVAVHPAH